MFFTFFTRTFFFSFLKPIFRYGEIGKKGQCTGLVRCDNAHLRAQKRWLGILWLYDWGIEHQLVEKSVNREVFGEYWQSTDRVLTEKKMHSHRFLCVFTQRKGKGAKKHSDKELLVELTQHGGKHLNVFSPKTKKNTPFSCLFVSQKPNQTPLLLVCLHFLFVCEAKA